MPYGIKKCSQCKGLYKGQTIQDWEIFLGSEFKVTILKSINYSLEYQKDYIGFRSSSGTPEDTLFSF